MSGPTKPASEGRQQVDPWRYGWRYVRQPGTNDTETIVRIPLARGDLLRPQEDDFVVHNANHGEDRHYLETMLRAHLTDRPEVHVFCDHRIDWGVQGLEPHGPDLAIIDGYPANWDKQLGTFCLSEFAAQPLLVIEITCPTTRDFDLDEKVMEYDRAGVPFYAIVDRRNYAEDQEVRLLAYRATKHGYMRVKLDSRGWLMLEPINLWLGVESLKLRCYEAWGKRMLDYRGAVKALEEARARQTAEERIRQLEAELNRLRGQA